ncbi:MAG: ATP-binding protein [Candidatus Levybacteria bacterium]|nr:ATP-binding protein [Candidatus Levybacteria bacterium]
MQSPTFYIFCGLPFAGKTVLTKKLIDKLGFVPVNIDDIKFARGFEGVSDDDVSDEDWQKIYQKSCDISHKCLNEGKSVLYDSSNLTRAIRDDIRKNMAKCNFSIKVLWLDIPFDIVKERYQKNKIKKERFDIPNNIFQEAIDTYEPPTEDENMILYTQDMDFDTWIKKNFYIAAE